MRALAATVIALTLAALAGGAQAREASVYRGECGVRSLPRAPANLPAPIEISTGCGAFRIEPSGRVVQIWRSAPNPAESGSERAVVSHDVGTGLKSVYLIGSDVPLYSHRSHDAVWFGVCGEGMSFRWRGTWLLYASGEGDLVAIESRSRRIVNLGPLLRRLPGGRPNADGKVSAGIGWSP
jgi:hypothetical protein